MYDCMYVLMRITLVHCLKAIRDRVYRVQSYTDSRARIRTSVDSVRHGVPRRSVSRYIYIIYTLLVVVHQFKAPYGSMCGAE